MARIGGAAAPTEPFLLVPVGGGPEELVATVRRGLDLSPDAVFPDLETGAEIARRMGRAAGVESWKELTRRARLSLVQTGIDVDRGAVVRAVPSMPVRPGPGWHSEPKRDALWAPWPIDDDHLAELIAGAIARSPTYAEAHPRTPRAPARDD
ncbi:MAG TPA: hypothetical protein VF228_10965 [Iamia sp.]